MDDIKELKSRVYDLIKIKEEAQVKINALTKRIKELENEEDTKKGNRKTKKEKQDS